jgi:hypothetical protein
MEDLYVLSPPLSTSSLLDLIPQDLDQWYQVSTPQEQGLEACCGFKYLQ